MVLLREADTTGAVASARACGRAEREFPTGWRRSRRRLNGAPGE
jgi:hypothetical protein